FLPPLGVCQFFSSAPVFLLPLLPPPPSRILVSVPGRLRGGLVALGLGGRGRLGRLARAVVWFDRAGSCWVRIVWVSCHAPSIFRHGRCVQMIKIRGVPSRIFSPHRFSFFSSFL